MPQTRKIATCCYCGTRAVLVLDQSRHELACSACGAPLHDMKLMPVPQESRQIRRSPPAKPAEHKIVTKERRVKPVKKYKRRKRKPLSRKIFEEIWDVVEDIFD